MAARVGDRVRLKAVRKGSRGKITRTAGKLLEVKVDEDNEIITVSPSEVTNFSEAARKAWKKMPSRSVGRPTGSRQCDRVSVTLRLDRELWDRFRQDEAAGSISDRTALVNDWFRKMLDHVEAVKDNQNGVQDH